MIISKLTFEWKLSNSFVLQICSNLYNWVEMPATIIFLFRWSIHGDSIEEQLRKVFTYRNSPGAFKPRERHPQLNERPVFNWSPCARQFGIAVKTKRFNGKQFNELVQNIGDL